MSRLTGRLDQVIYTKSSVPIKNLSSYVLDTTCLNNGLNHCFIDKNKFVKRNIAVELESLAHIVDSNVPAEVKEDFHEYLRGITNKFAQNIYHTKDNTFKSLKELRNNKDIVILSGDKDSSVVILNKVDYVNKVNAMIDEGVIGGKYVRTTDNTHELQNFQQFIYRNFQNHKDYVNLRPNSHEHGKFFATAKTHKFKTFGDINVDELRLRPIIDQTGSYTHGAAKIISKYLQPLTKNECY